MFALATLLALASDVAIVEGSTHVTAGRIARYHITLLHPGAGLPGRTSIRFGDGTQRALVYAAGLSPGVFDARAGHVFARAGRYAITVATASGRVLASEAVVVGAAPDEGARNPPVGGAPVGAARAPVIVAPAAAGAAADPTRSGILVAPNPPAPAADVAAPVAAPPGPETNPAAATPATSPATAARAGARPRATVAPLAVPDRAPTPAPTETPRLTTGDR